MLSLNVPLLGVPVQESVRGGARMSWRVTEPQGVGGESCARSVSSAALLGGCREAGSPWTHQPASRGSPAASPLGPRGEMGDCASAQGQQRCFRRETRFLKGHSMPQVGEVAPVAPDLR